MISLSCLSHVLDYWSPLPPSSSIICSRTFSAIVCFCIKMAVLRCLDININILLLLRTSYLGYELQALPLGARYLTGFNPYTKHDVC